MPKWRYNLCQNIVMTIDIPLSSTIPVPIMEIEKLDISFDMNIH